MPPANEPFDEVLAKLETTVGTLEGGRLSLEESLAAFEEGARLARHGQEILDAAQKRIEMLVPDGTTTPAIKPFATPEE